jgi:hypothetical protein
MSPWDLKLQLGGWGNRAGEYVSYNGWGWLTVGRVEQRSRAEVSVGGNGGVEERPPLEVDGMPVSIDSKNWHMAADAEYAWLYNHCYSIGGAASAWRDDPKAQHRYGSYAKLGVEWDRFRADDPRGNRLAVLYAVGYTVERYNLPNVLGERFARYPVHEATASGNVRKDKVSFGLSLTIGGELVHPMRRHHITASPRIEWQLGDHVDLEMSFSITKREFPPPDEAFIDPSDYEQQSRLSYAEPLQMNTSFSLEIHWDRTNGARNDRLQDL